jgi:hypothetical protein
MAGKGETMFNLTPHQWLIVGIIIAAFVVFCFFVWLYSVLRAGSYNPPENIDEEIKFTPPGKLNPDEDDTPLTEAQLEKAIMDDWLALHTTKD